MQHFLTFKIRHKRPTILKGQIEKD